MHKYLDLRAGRREKAARRKANNAHREERNAQRKRLGRPTSQVRQPSLCVPFVLLHIKFVSTWAPLACLPREHCDHCVRRSWRARGEATGSASPSVCLSVFWRRRNNLSPPPLLVCVTTGGQRSLWSLGRFSWRPRLFVRCRLRAAKTMNNNNFIFRRRWRNKLRPFGSPKNSPCCCPCCCQRQQQSRVFHQMERERSVSALSWDRSCAYTRVE